MNAVVQFSRNAMLHFAIDCPIRNCIKPITVRRFVKDDGAIKADFVSCKWSSRQFHVVSFVRPAR